MNELAYSMRVATAVLFAMAPAQAQDASHVNGAQRSASDRALGRVYVTESSPGSETVGRLIYLGLDTVRLLVDGQEKELRLENVLRIDREGDSLKNGAIIGAIAMGAWCALVCGQGLDSESQWLPAVAANAGWGGLIGLGLDALHRGRTTIYRRPAPSPAPTSAALLAYRVSF